MKVFSDSPQKTIEIGRKLGKYLEPGDVIYLSGSLGAGKTHFAKGVALGLGVEDHVTSPTFTLINEYEGRMPFYHVDVYRLEEEEEAHELGLEEYLYGSGVTLIEWPERIKTVLPEDYLAVELRFTGTGSEARELEISARGERYEKLVEQLKQKFAGDVWALL